MLKFWLFVVNFLTGVALAVMMVRDRLRDDSYVTKVVVERPLDVVWPWLADPRKYPELAPGWLTAVDAPAAGPLTIRLPGNAGPQPLGMELDAARHTVDLTIGSESCSFRAVALDARRTAVIVFAKRWDSCGVVPWVRYKWTVSRDLGHAQAVIERATASLP